jgi:hypothetical protein
MKITKPGIYRGVEADHYFADPTPEPSLSQSICKILIEQSPLHARQAHPRLAVTIGDEDETADKYDAAKAKGNAAHAMMLGRGKTMAIIDHPNFMTKLAKEARAEAIAAGKEPILAKHWDVASHMVIAARKQLSQIPYCQDAFVTGHGDAEVVVANCEDGQWLRSMIDWITPDLAEVWDLKTSGMSASPYATGRLMASAGWHLQAAMHERILDEIDPNGAGRRKFRYVCQENEPPFALTVNEIGEAALTIGRKQIEYAIKAWRRCVETDVWPAYPLRIIRPELPAWAENSWIDREIKEYEAEQDAAPRKDFNPANLMAG